MAGQASLPAPLCGPSSPSVHATTREGEGEKLHKQDAYQSLVRHPPHPIPKKGKTNIHTIGWSL